MSGGPQIEFLDVDDDIELQTDQVATFGGVDGVQRMELLESAVAMPQQGFFGKYAHAFPFEMAAAYLYHLARNQAFHDGNKRVGAQAAIVFLRMNGWELEADPDDFADLTLAVVAAKRDKPEVAAWLEQRCQPMK